MKKEITSTVYVSINGEYHRWENLTKEMQDAISIELNCRAMESIGYRRRNKEKTA
jgi:hypothetical protein